jgi:hypothetical protein
MICGCVSVMSLERQATIDGLVLYGFVNVAPSAEITKDRMRSDLAKASCALYPDDWCRQQEDFEFVSLMLMNTYAGGLRGVGTFVPLSEKVAKGDIVVIRSRQRGTAEFLRVASRGERDDCGWVGGGITRALTAAGVVCENYDWKQFAPLFYD